MPTRQRFGGYRTTSSAYHVPKHRAPFLLALSLVLGDWITQRLGQHGPNVPQKIHRCPNPVMNSSRSLIHHPLVPALESCIHFPPRLQPRLLGLPTLRLCPRTHRPTKRSQCADVVPVHLVHLYLVSRDGGLPSCILTQTQVAVSSLRESLRRY